MNDRFLFLFLSLFVSFRSFIRLCQFPILLLLLLLLFLLLLGFVCFISRIWINNLLLLSLFVAVTCAKVWALDRRVFQQVMKKTGLQRIDDNLKFLRSVPLLERLSTDHMAKIADVLEVVSSLSFFFFDPHFLI